MRFHHHTTRSVCCVRGNRRSEPDSPTRPHAKSTQAPPLVTEVPERLPKRAPAVTQYDSFGSTVKPDATHDWTGRPGSYAARIPCRPDPGPRNLDLTAASERKDFLGVLVVEGLLRFRAEDPVSEIAVPEAFAELMINCLVPVSVSLTGATKPIP